ncbi:calcium-binding protein, partial [Campylobacter showae]
AGNDILDGGAGNDYLEGGAGNDTYVFGKGDGNDTIYNYSNSGKDEVDTIKFKEGITKEDLTFSREYNNDYSSNLLIGIKGTNDSITVHSLFDGTRNAQGSLNEQFLINRIEFSDGSYMDAEDIKKAVLLSPNSNSIYGFNSNDTIRGNSDDNYIFGYDGNDTIYGHE